MAVQRLTNSISTDPLIEFFPRTMVWKGILMILHRAFHGVKRRVVGNRIGFKDRLNFRLDLEQRLTSVPSYSEY